MLHFLTDPVCTLKQLASFLLQNQWKMESCWLLREEVLFHLAHLHDIYRKDHYTITDDDQRVFRNLACTCKRAHYFFREFVRKCVLSWNDQRIRNMIYSINANTGVLSWHTMLDPEKVLCTSPFNMKVFEWTHKTSIVYVRGETWQITCAKVNRKHAAVIYIFNHTQNRYMKSIRLRLKKWDLLVEKWTGFQCFNFADDSLILFIRQEHHVNGRGPVALIKIRMTAGAAPTLELNNFPSLTSKTYMNLGLRSHGGLLLESLFRKNNEWGAVFYYVDLLTFTFDKDLFNKRYKFKDSVIVGKAIPAEVVNSKGAYRLSNVGLQSLAKKRGCFYLRLEYEWSRPSCVLGFVDLTDKDQKQINILSYLSGIKELLQQANDGRLAEDVKYNVYTFAVTEKQCVLLASHSDHLAPPKTLFVWEHD